MTVKIAFLFLLTDRVRHSDIWTKFFENIDKKKYSIYSHIKKNTDMIPKYISEHKIKTIKTSWCGENLVTAFVNMVKEALKDKSNKFFVLLSGECIPLYTFDKIYENIISDGRSRINVYERVKKRPVIKEIYADQWILLNKKMAKKFISITEHYDELRKFVDMGLHCPDEIYPIYFFLDSFFTKDGKDGKDATRKVVTYTKWSNGGMHPMKFNKNNYDIQEICGSGALFARKFFMTAAKEVAMAC